MYIESGKTNKFLFSDSLCSASVTSNPVEQSYNQMLASVFSISESSDASPQKDSFYKKQTFLEPPMPIGTPDPQLATFDKTAGQSSKQNMSELTLGGPTMPTEGDVFELDLTLPDSRPKFQYESDVATSLQSRIGYLPYKIYCAKCKTIVTSEISEEKLSFWEELFNGFRCCSNPFIYSQNLVHSCPECGEVLENVSC